MNDSRHLDWPFFEAHHRTLAIEMHRWAAGLLVEETEHGVDKACCRLVRQLGADGWLKYAVGGTAFGGSSDTIDTRAICLIRETLARHSGLADFAFAMQGLGSGAITLFGTLGQKKKYLPAVAKGQAIGLLPFVLTAGVPLLGTAVAICFATWRIKSERYVLGV